jgi:hypothetical protein
MIIEKKHMTPGRLSVDLFNTWDLPILPWSYLGVSPLAKTVTLITLDLLGNKEEPPMPLLE